MQGVSVKVTLTILGQLASMKNSRQIIYVNGKPRIIPKPEAISWEKTALMQIPADHRIGLEGPIRLTCVVYYANRRSDLDIALVMDTLQHAGVIKNDRSVIEIHATKKLDPSNPRVELVIEELVRTAGQPSQ